MKRKRLDEVSKTTTENINHHPRAVEGFAMTTTGSTTLTSVTSASSVIAGASVSGTGISTSVNAAGSTVTKKKELIHHDPRNKVFELFPFADGKDSWRGRSAQRCVLEYELMDGEGEKGTMAITETFVPPRLRGKGLASLLCDAAFDYAESKEWTINPICTYVRDWVAKRPHRLALVASSSSKSEIK